MSASDKSVDISVFRVPVEKLSCAPIPLNFGTTEEIEPLESHVFIGQPRAEEAIKRGLATPGHIFAAGLDSINTALLERIKKEAGAIMRGRRIPDSVCVYNFEHPQKPRFIELEKGHACRLERDMEKLLTALKEKIPQRLSGEAFRKAEKDIRDIYGDQTKDVLNDLSAEMESETSDIQGLGEVCFTYNIGHGGVTIFPVIKSDPRRPMSPKEYEDLKGPEREKVDKTRKKFMYRVSDVMENEHKRERDMDDEIDVLKRDTVNALLVEEITDIISEYGDAISGFIDALRQYTLDHISIFLPQNDNHASSPMSLHHADPFLPFKINVFVDNSKIERIPVVDHRNADHDRLFGKISYTIGPGGTLIEGHTDIHAGLLNEANHGVLVLQAADVFSRPGIWDRLKAVLETKRLDIGRSNSYSNLTPETLHINVKLVLVGDWYIYRLLLNTPGIRDQFAEIFKTVVQFDSQVHRSDEIIRQLAGLIRLFCERDDLPHVSSCGMAELLRHLSRVENDQGMFSMDFRSLKDILNEAAWLAGKGVVITATNVKQAIRAKIYRLDLIREKIYEHIRDGTLLLSLNGKEVGQINALSVYDLEDFKFGAPSRVTVKTFAGRGGVISIDRDVKLAGPLHSKGILTLSGYLGWKYAQEKPLSFSANVSFEQNYSGTEGDSASVAELYALLSSISEEPIRQDIAVTGSVNQNGEVQPIGGVNEKVEGFFDVCSIFGLTGEQGVMIPHQNVKNLMLRDDVVEAVRQGKFHVYAVKMIDEGMEILTGKKMGEKIKRGEHKGQYQKGTINWLVSKRLEELAKASGGQR